MKLVSTLLTGGLVVGSLLAVTAPSQAALTTSCVGEAGAVTVPGNLVVPKDKSCTLDGTVIQGNVTVRSGADLVIGSGTIEGNLVAQADAFVDAESTSIGGNVVSRGSYGVFLTESSVSGNYNSPANAVRGGFLLADQSQLDGRVTDRSGSVLLVSSTIAKNVLTDGNVATDVDDSVVFGSLTVNGAEEGALLCDSEIDGAASYEANAAPVQIGGDTPWGTCVGSTYFGGDLTVNDTTGGVHLTDAIIRGDLAGEGNDPAPVGSDNRVRGEISGQFVDLQEPSLFGARAVPGEDRIAEAREAAEERSQVAELEAEKAGPANL